MADSTYKQRIGQEVLNDFPDPFLPTEGVNLRTLEERITNSGGGATISSVIPVTTNHLLTTTSNNAIVRVKDYASVIVPSGLGLKHRTVIKKATGKTVSLTAGENVVFETPSGYIDEVLAQYDAVEIVCEEITNGVEYWGVYGALAQGDTYILGTKKAIDINEVSLPTIAWPKMYKSSDYPEVTTTKDYFAIYSTDHDTGSGGVNWAECDDPEWAGFVERGTIVSGYQAEYPWIIKIPTAESGLASDTIFLYYHTDASDPDNNSIQQTHLLTTSGGELHTATWTQQGKVLGVETGETHTGYLRVWKRGVGDYIGHHLTKEGTPGEMYVSSSPDGLNWTRVTVVDVTSGMPAGGSWDRQEIQIIENGVNAFIHYKNDDGTNSLSVATIDSNNLPTSLGKAIIDDKTGLAQGGLYIENNIAYFVFRKGGSGDVRYNSWYLYKYNMNDL